MRAGCCRARRSSMRCSALRSVSACANALIPTGTFNSEDIWPAGLFLEKNTPADPPAADDAATRNFLPEVSKLDKAVRKLPAELPVVILVPPTFASTVPQPGSAVAWERQACDAALTDDRRRPPAQQFHQLPRRQRADPRPRQLPRLHPLSSADRRENIGRNCREHPLWAKRPGSISDQSSPIASSRPSSQSIRASPRWIFPLVVFGSVPGRISAIWRANNSCWSATPSRISPFDLLRIDPVALGAFDLLDDRQGLFAVLDRRRRMPLRHSGGARGAGAAPSARCPAGSG